MDNPEEVMQILERFNVTRNPEITAQLEEYITFVARTGDSVYAWSLVRNLYREKLINVITDFYNETPTKGKFAHDYNNNIQPAVTWRFVSNSFQSCLSTQTSILSTTRQ
jgi:PPP4R2